MGFSLRQNEVPINGTILWLKSSNPPLGYVHDSSLDSKYVKGVATDSTNPGTTGGSNSHTHACTGAHVHCVNGSHTHNIGVATNPSNAAGGGPSSAAAGSHTHNKTSSSAGAAGDSDSFGAHLQGSVNSEPIRKEFKYIKKTTVISLRNKDIPPCGIIYWTKSTTLPSTYSSCTTSLDTFVKGTSASCVAPGSSGGATTHGHGTEGCHTHTQTLATHGHTYGGCWNAASATTNVFPAIAAQSCPFHTHSGNPSDVDRDCDNSNSTSASHDHGTSTNNPAHVTTILAIKKQHSLRQVGIPTGGSIMWTCPLACIPTHYSLQDGTLTTTDTIDKMLKVIPTGCATPGAAVGINGHQHGTNSSHGHTFNTPHGHSINAGSTSTAPSVGGNNSGPAQSASTHSHAFNSNTSGAAARTGNCTSGHQHSCTNLRPAFTEVAFIERIDT